MEQNQEKEKEDDIVITDDEEQEITNRRICQVCGTKKVVRYSSGKKKPSARDNTKKVMAFCMICSHKKKRNEKLSQHTIKKS